MANYIKVNPKVAIHCGLRGMRPILPDGNSALWLNDISHFGAMKDRAEILPRIGGVWLSGPQLREEHFGRLVTPLPEPTEERFVLTEEELREFYPKSAMEESEADIPEYLPEEEITEPAEAPEGENPDEDIPEDEKGGGEA